MRRDRKGLAFLVCAALAASDVAAIGAEERSKPVGGIEGVVLLDGKPVAGAVVSLHAGVANARSPFDDAQVERAMALLDAARRDEAPVATQTSDASGRFRFGRLDHAYYGVEARDASGRIGFDGAVEVEPLRWSWATITLSTPRTLAGRIVDAAGAGAKGTVRLSVVAKSRFASPVHPHVAVRTAALAADGSFRFPDATDDSFQVTLVSANQLALLPTRSGLDATAATYVLPATAPRTVTVATTAGKPVAGARVVTDGVESGGMTFLAGGVTDGSGRLSIALPVAAHGILRVAPARFDATSLGFAADESAIAVRIPVEAASARVVGRVLDESGEPVGGVAVRAMNAGDAFLVESSPTPAVTAADGTFRLDGVGPGPTWFAALGAGYASPRLSEESGPPRASEAVRVLAGDETAVDLRVVPAARVEGRVTDEAGAAVPGARVRWRTSSDTVPHTSEWLPEAEQAVETGPDGRFTLSTLPSEVRVRVIAAAASFLEGEAEVRVGRGGGATTNASIVLKRSRWLSLRVIDRDGGKPIAGAHVELAPTRGGDSDVGEFHHALDTSASGAVVVGGMPRTALHARVRHEAFVERDGIEIPAGDETVVDVALEAGLSISGTVTRRGRPIADATIWAESPAGRAHRSVLSRSDANGAFRVAGLDPGPWRLGAVTGKGRAEAVAEAGAAGVVLELPDEMRDVVVRVADADGHPVPSASFRWRAPGRSGGGYVVDGRREIETDSPRDPEGWTVEVFAPTDASNRALPFGPARVGPLQAGRFDVDVRLPRGRTVAGRVVLPSGAGAAGFEVAAHDVVVANDEGPRVLGRATTAADGSFAIPSLGEGEVLLFASTRDPTATAALAAPVRVASGADVVLTLVERGVVTVTVLDGTKPLAGAGVTAERRVAESREERAIATTDEHGRARLEAIAPGGVYGLTIVQREGKGEVVRLRRESWRAADETITLGADPLVRGSVRDDVGRPFPSVFVWVEKAGQPSGLAITAENGTFALDPQAEGEVSVRATPAFDLWSDGFFESALASPSVVVRAGAKDVVLTMSRGVRAHVVVEGGLASWKGRSFTLSRETEPWNADASHGAVALPADGPVDLPPLERGGRYRLWLPAGSDGRCMLQAFVAEEGATVSLRPVPSVSLSGTVDVPTGATEFSVVARGHGFFSTGVVRPDGRFTVGALPPGEVVDVQVDARVGEVAWRAIATTRIDATPRLVLAPTEGR